MNNWNFFHQTDEEEKEENGFDLSTKPHGMTDQEEDEDTQVKSYDPATNIRNKLLAGAERSGLKQDNQHPKAPKIELSKPQDGSKSVLPKFTQEKQRNTEIEPSMMEQNSPKLEQKAASSIAQPSAQPPIKPNLQNLVSDDAKADNANIAKTLLTKSSEISGLSPLFDHMLKEDSLGGKAVIDDLVTRVRVDDPDTAQKLQHAANPILHKYGKAMQVAQANLDAQYQQDLAAYQQLSQTSDPIIDDQSNDDILYGSAGNDDFNAPETEMVEAQSSSNRFDKITDASEKYDNPHYTEFLGNLLEHESGYSDDPDDNSGATLNGVSTKLLDSLKAKPEWQHLPDATKDLTPDQVSEIYYKEYYKRLHFDKLLGVDGIQDTKLAEQIFDFSVNSNSITAGKMLQQIMEELDPTINIRTISGELDGIIGEVSRRAISKLIKNGLGKELNNKLAQKRLEYMQSLDDWPKYKNGWATRANSYLMK